MAERRRLSETSVARLRQCAPTSFPHEHAPVVASPAELGVLAWPGARPARHPRDRVTAVRRYCANKILAQPRRAAGRVGRAWQGRHDLGASWHPNLGPDWERQRVAQLRYHPDDHV
jgi:hypothetical protein